MAEYQRSCRLVGLAGRRRRYVSIWQWRGSCTRSPRPEISQLLIPPRNLHFPPFSLHRIITAIFETSTTVRRHHTRQFSAPMSPCTHHVHRMTLQHAFGGIAPQQRACEIRRAALLDQNRMAEREPRVSAQKVVQTVGSSRRCGTPVEWRRAHPGEPRAGSGCTS